MINPNLNNNSHQLRMMQPRQLLLDGGGGGGTPVVNGTSDSSKVDLAQQVMDNYNNGSATIEELKAVLDKAGIKYNDNGSTISFDYNSKSYIITYNGGTTADNTLDQVIKDMGLRTTYCEGVYCSLNPDANGNRTHYVWDAKNETMVSLGIYKHVDSKGSQLRGNANYEAYLQGYNFTDTLGVYEKDGKLYVFNGETKSFVEQSLTVNANNSSNIAEYGKTVEEYIKELEVKYAEIYLLIEKHGGEVSETIKNQLKDIEDNIKYLKEKSSVNIKIDLSDLNLDAIDGYSSNERSRLRGKKSKEGQALKDDALAVLNTGLKDALYQQLLPKAESFGITEEAFKQMFDSIFNKTADSVINNSKYFISKDRWIDAFDKTKYKVKDLVDGFIKEFEINIQKALKDYINNNPSDAFIENIKPLDELLTSINHELLADTSAKITVHVDQISTDNIIGYADNVVRSKEGKDGQEREAVQNNVANLFNKYLKEQLYVQLLVQAESLLGIPKDEFESVFNDTFEQTTQEIINNNNYVITNDYWIDSLDVTKYNVKNVIDGFIKLFGSNIQKAITKYMMLH